MAQGNTTIITTDYSKPIQRSTEELKALAQREGGVYLNDDNGERVEWRNADNQLHRDEDVPSIVWGSGELVWFFGGRIHRANGKPALMYADGLQSWYRDGLRLKTEVVPQ